MIGKDEKIDAFTPKDYKEFFEKEKTDLRKKTEKRVAATKAANKVTEVFYKQRADGKVCQCTRTKNGNLYSKLMGSIKDNPELAKLVGK